jgi:hypothetical protein
MSDRNALYATRQAKKRSPAPLGPIVVALVRRRTFDCGPRTRLLLTLAEIGPQLGGETPTPFVDPGVLVGFQPHDPS